MEKEQVGAESPLVSVIMIVRDGQATISLALASLLRQSYKNWECIVVNDASLDRTQAILESLRDPRFQVRRSKTPLGRGLARGEALRGCKGDYITTLDCDDFYFADTLVEHVSVLESNREISATVGSLLLFNGRRGYLGRLRRQPGAGEYQIPIGPSELKMPFGSMMFRRTILEGLEFNPALTHSEDRELYTRALAGRRVRVLARPLYAYRWSLKLQKVLVGLRENEGIYRTHLESYPCRALAVVFYTRAKYWLYRLLNSLGLWERANYWRLMPGLTSEKTFFETELSAIQEQSYSFEPVSFSR